MYLARRHNRVDKPRAAETYHKRVGRLGETPKSQYRSLVVDNGVGCRDGVTLCIVPCALLPSLLSLFALPALPPLPFPPLRTSYVRQPKE